MTVGGTRLALRASALDCALAAAAAAAAAASSSAVCPPALAPSPCTPTGSVDSTGGAAPVAGATSAAAAPVSALLRCPCWRALSGGCGHAGALHAAAAGGTSSDDADAACALCSCVCTQLLRWGRPPTASPSAASEGDRATTPLTLHASTASSSTRCGAIAPTAGARWALSSDADALPLQLCRGQDCAMLINAALCGVCALLVCSSHALAGHGAHDAERAQRVPPHRACQPQEQHNTHTSTQVHVRLLLPSYKCHPMGRRESLLC